MAGIRTDALRVTPRALLLDFGGVVFQTTKHPTGRDDMALRLHHRLARAGYDVAHPTLRASLDAALTALAHWKHSSSRRREPREMTHREVVGDFLAADLAAGPRDVLVAAASDVLAELNTTLSAHELRPGIRDLVGEAQRRGIPLGIVSNAHSGRSHRALLAATGLAEAFGVQVYSDEVGMRKPHPGMIELAAAALGVDPAHVWYVGDTMDRDVVAGRRAGVQAVVLTASKHTDNPPFGVDAQPDAVFPTPEGLYDALVASRPDAGARPGGAVAEPPARAALFIDHGGVISASRPDDELLDAFAQHLARVLSAPGEPATVAEARGLLAAAKVRHRRFKAAQRAAHAASGTAIGEIDPITFWRDFVGADLSPRRRAVLEAESSDLMFRYGRAKSRRTLREGVRELLETCRDRRMPVVVVSNTVSGRAVRAECAAHGIDALIGAYVCSDEVGVRKPDPAIAREALRVAGADPARSWFYGDKPENDAAVARAVGIAERVIVRGGSTPDEAVHAARASGLATRVVDSAHELAALIAAADASAATDRPHTLALAGAAPNPS